MTVDEIYTAIVSGDADGQFARINRAIAVRQDIIAGQIWDKIEPGVTRVRVNTAHIKPRYLDGATATVIAKRVRKVTIRFDQDINDPYRKWAGNNCIISPEHLEIIDADAEPEERIVNGARVREVPFE
jgi:hypothetical protein